MKTYFIRRIMFFHVWLERKNIRCKWLFNFLYPDHDTPLTPEEIEELKEAFKPWKE